MREENNNRNNQAPAANVNQAADPLGPHEPGLPEEVQKIR